MTCFIMIDSKSEPEYKKNKGKGLKEDRKEKKNTPFITLPLISHQQKKRNTDRSSL